MNKIKMLYYDRIDISEGIDINNISASKECDICHHLLFQPNVCNRCRDLFVMSMYLNLNLYVPTLLF